MRVLLSTIGSRGEVEPLLGLALELRALHHEVRVCAPPDFKEMFDPFEIPYVSIGPELRKLSITGPASLRTPLTPEQLRQLAKDSVAAQFKTIGEAARGCDLLLSGGALQMATHSVAEAQGLAYVYASYCPITLPSPHHAPPVMGIRGDVSPPATTDYRTLWAEDAQQWNQRFGGLINEHRAAMGLSSVSDVRTHIFTAHPWLAADPIVAPWPASSDLDVFQTGAWMRSDQRALSAEIESFLDAGDAPIYIGFGSIRVPGDFGRAAIEAARALGRRAIIARGWAELAPVDDGSDWLSIGEVNQQALFRRVPAVVHHGGAGTTTAAARSGAPQVLVPQMYDQPYWARQIERLGIGATALPTTESLTNALELALKPEIAARARAIAGEVRTDGAREAARALENYSSRSSASPSKSSSDNTRM